MLEKYAIKHKPMITDLTFFTNEPDQTLLDRFKVTIEQNTRFFDVLVGFFKTSGFLKLYESLEKTEKIRILVGISLNRYAYELIQKANPPSPPLSKGGAGKKKKGFFFEDKRFRLQEKLKNLDRFEEYDEFIKVTKENAKEIRENILKYLMVRRTRNEIVRYFEDDLKKQDLKFPDVADPKQVLYEFDTKLDKIFTETIKLATSTAFKYARYTSLLYLKEGITHPEKLAQINMGKFMKILLVKRLESSFFAFKNTLGRFIKSYETFIREYDKGRVFVSKKHINKVFELLENDDEEAIQRLIDEDKAEEYKSEDFDESFRKDLENDLKILKQVNEMWTKIDYDPKIDKFLNLLENDNILTENKLIVFTESKETADYLEDNIRKKIGDIVLGFSGSSGAAIKEKVIENFDAKARYPKDDYRILITTEVLSEGVNLHRSNVVINYDIPWNPTRLMQRVGRLNP